MELFISVILLIVGFVLLVKGADFLVDGAAGIAARFGIPQLVIGLTIVAMGTSAPEASVSITAALGGNAGISVGNIIGSNIFNILVILGITSVIAPISVRRSTLRYEAPFMLIITVVLMLFGLGGEISRVEGVILWILFIAYLAYLFVAARRGSNDIDDLPAQKKLWVQFALLIGGLAAVIIGGSIVVDNAVVIASALGMSDRLISLTVIAFGTSLPELVTSIAAVRRGNADLAIGNIVGSNVFNILFVIGSSSLIIPITFADQFLIDSVIALFAGLMLWFGAMNRDKKLKRPVGILMLLSYAAYFVYLLLAR
ncbi:MAG: calcium/sodium antiporter [Acutalibacteraceae bacterium]